MNPGERLLRYQQLADRVRQLEDEAERLHQRLSVDEESERLQLELDQAHAAHAQARRRLESMDRDMNAHLSRMRQHERELMSGRIRSPSDLARMSQEVDHMKAALAVEEDAELEVMTEVERAEAAEQALAAGVREARERWARARPGLQAALAHAESEREEAAAERDAEWGQVPPEYQAEYRRLARIPSPVAAVAGGVCQACHVALTPSQLQQLRRGDHLVTCDNCSRILVAV